MTMDWWDDLWLNEGFASFFEYVGVEQAESDWGMVSTCLNHSNMFLNRQYLSESIPLSCLCPIQSLYSIQQRDIILINDVFPVMVDDALLSSHPIIVDVSSPAEITSVFDAISYNKVKSVMPDLVMLIH